MNITKVEIVTKDAIPISDCYRATKDGVVCWVPLDESNTDYQEILRLVQSGELVIETVEQI